MTTASESDSSETEEKEVKGLIRLTLRVTQTEYNVYAKAWQYYRQIKRSKISLSRFILMCGMSRALEFCKQAELEQVTQTQTETRKRGV